MNDIRSSSPLRNIITNSVAQLQQQATRVLPDGATAYVTATDALYRLYKGVGTTFDTLTTLVVIPGDQSSNRWILQESVGSSPWAAVEVLDESIITTPAAQFAWRSIGENGGSYSLAFGSATAFVLAANSQLTYHGPDRNMAINLKTTVSHGIAAEIALHAVVSVNNDVPDGDTNEQRAFGENGASMPNAGEACIATERLVLLSDGDTVRVKYRNMSTADAFVVVFMTLSLTPL